MKWFLFLIPSLALADCGIKDILPTIRPGATWALSGQVYSGLIWMDVSQTKPTQTEVDTAVAACVAKESSDKTAKDQAKAILKDAKSTDSQKIGAIIKVFGLDQ